MGEVLLCTRHLLGCKVAGSDVSVQLFQCDTVHDPQWINDVPVQMGECASKCVPGERMANCGRDSAVCGRQQTTGRDMGVSSGCCLHEAGWVTAVCGRVCSPLCVCACVRKWTCATVCVSEHVRGCRVMKLCGCSCRKKYGKGGFSVQHADSVVRLRSDVGQPVHAGKTWV